MKDKSDSSHSWMIAGALLLCAFAWGFLLLAWGSKTRKAPSSVSVSAVHEKDAPSMPPAGTQGADDKRDQPSPQRFVDLSKGGFSGTVRLKRDESAVLSYSELAPGMYGAVIITPELQPDGKVDLKTRLVRMTERDASGENFTGILPDAFEIERQGALNKQRLDDFLAATTKQEDAEVSEMSSQATKPGEGTGFVLNGTNKDGSPFNDGKGLMLMMTPEPLEDSGGFDLKYNLNHLEPQSSDTPGGVFMAPR